MNATLWRTRFQSAHVRTGDSYQLVARRPHTNQDDARCKHIASELETRRLTSYVSGRPYQDRRMLDCRATCRLGGCSARALG